MPEEKTHRIRLRLPGGAEFEAEGSADFVQRERKEFLSSVQAPDGAGPLMDSGTPETAGTGLGAPRIAWDAITELKGRNIHLRSKLPGGRTEKDACLVLLAASQKLLNQPKPTATQLAKWLRSSGYPVLRMDRALQDAVTQGEILSSGSRRARRYELTASGRLKAFVLADQLTGLVLGRGA